MRNQTWTIAGGGGLTPAPFLVAGIVNVTPDSFSDGGRYLAPDAAIAHGHKLAGEGAHMLDVGGESTRPGARDVSLAQELDRVLPVVRGLAGKTPAIVSVDTVKAKVAAAALEAGAAVVNDVSACRWDPELVDVLAQHKPGYVLMHAQGTPRTMQADPRYGDVVEDILAFFEERLNMLARAGLPEDRVALDPGIGFGKTLEHNLAILSHMERFAVLGRPLYVGLSNKSLWGKLLGLGTDDRLIPTVAATALLAARGVAVHRVHHVAAAVQALAVAQAITPDVRPHESAGGSHGRVA